ncbi:hypothetical protein [Pseudosulfitobacter sp. DSM 107133]|uniref:hypothetical protein n=1 Tax=Pseudosulfitobacter sp. DSM 107133 TaxID=2883100 RepID=UPI001FAD473F|nr:hypothetical protein [Pseudosulfitobacter sp. DSM 107133]
MTANQITFLLVPLVACMLVVYTVLHVRKLKKNQPPKVHGPHTPGAGYDAKEIARGKGNGMADGGVG